MVRKASHGWSFRQQGGFRPKRSAGSIFKAKQIKRRQKKPSPLINQALSIGQAANIGAVISFKCLACNRSKSKDAVEFLRNFPNIKSEGLRYITAKSFCSGCKSRRVEVKYILDKKFRKYAKLKSYGFNLLENEAWLDYYDRD